MTLGNPHDWSFFFGGGFSIAMFDDRRVMIPGKLWPSLAFSFFCAATHVRELIDPFVKEMSKSKSLSLGASQHCMGSFFLHRQERFREFRATLSWRSQWGWGDGCITTTVFARKEGQKEEGKGSEAKDGAIFF